MIRPQQVWMGVLALAVLLVLAAPVAANEMTGVLTSVDRDNYQLFVTDQEAAEWEFSLSLIGQVLINDEERDISDLRPGDDVTITFQFDEERMVAAIVRVARE